MVKYKAYFRELCSHWQLCGNFVILVYEFGRILSRINLGPGIGLTSYFLFMGGILGYYSKRNFETTSISVGTLNEYSNNECNYVWDSTRSITWV